MRKLFLTLMAAVLAGSISAAGWRPAEWPALKHYDAAHLYQIALPLGGIGTGQVSLGGRGELRNWAIMNIPAIGFSTVYEGSDNAPFFAVYARPEGGEPTTTLLEGPLYDQELMHGGGGEEVNHHGMPRFAQASFDAAYPFGQVNLSDTEVPLKVRIKGFNPLVPGCADDSSLPVAVLSYEVTNTGGRPMDVAVCGTMRNFIGRDGHNGMAGAKQNRNQFRETDGFKGIYFYSEGVDREDPAWGTMALTTYDEGQISHRTCSRPNTWHNALLNFWDDFSADGELTEREWPLENDPMASLAVKRRIAPGKTETFVFFLQTIFF